MKPSSRLARPRQRLGGARPTQAAADRSFVSQKGGVGKSTLGAPVRRRRRASRPQAAACRFRSRTTDLRGVERDQAAACGRTRHRRPSLQEPQEATQEPRSAPKSSWSTHAASLTNSRRRSRRTATSCSCRPAPRATILRPTLALARKLAKNGAEGRSSSCSRRSAARKFSCKRRPRRSRASGFELLAERRPQRDGFQADLDSGRAGREARNPYFREAAEKMEQALFARAQSAKPR